MILLKVSVDLLRKQPLLSVFEHTASHQNKLPMGSVCSYWLLVNKRSHKPAVGFTSKPAHAFKSPLTVILPPLLLVFFLVLCVEVGATSLNSFCCWTKSNVITLPPVNPRGHRSNLPILVWACSIQFLFFSRRRMRNTK